MVWNVVWILPLRNVRSIPNVWYIAHENNLIMGDVWIICPNVRRSVYIYSNISTKVHIQTPFVSTHCALLHQMSFTHFANFIFLLCSAQWCCFLFGCLPKSCPVWITIAFHSDPPKRVKFLPVSLFTKEDNTTYFMEPYLPGVCVTGEEKKHKKNTEDCNPVWAYTNGARIIWRTIGGVPLHFDSPLGFFFCVLCASIVRFHASNPSRKLLDYLLLNMWWCHIHIFAFSLLFWDPTNGHMRRKKGECLLVLGNEKGTNLVMSLQGGNATRSTTATMDTLTRAPMPDIPLRRSVISVTSTPTGSLSSLIFRYASQLLFNKLDDH